MRKIKRRKEKKRKAELPPGDLSVVYQVAEHELGKLGIFLQALNDIVCQLGKNLIRPGIIVLGSQLGGVHPALGNAAQDIVPKAQISLPPGRKCIGVLVNFIPLDNAYAGVGKIRINIVHVGVHIRRKLVHGACVGT